MEERGKNRPNLRQKLNLRLFTNWANALGYGDRPILTLVKPTLPPSERNLKNSNNTACNYLRQTTLPLHLWKNVAFFINWSLCLNWQTSKFHNTYRLPDYQPTMNLTNEQRDINSTYISLDHGPRPCVSRPCTVQAKGGTQRLQNNLDAASS